MLDQNCRFDWYQATVYVPEPSHGGLAGELVKAWDLADFAPDRGMHGYLHGAKVVRGDRTLCRVWWGGNPGVNITCSGEDSPVLAELLQRLGLPFGVTRADACCDWVEPGLFDSLAGHLIAFAQDKTISINQQGDWVRGQARTLYLGSPQSPVRLVLYEKGYEQGGDAPKDWVRLEVRVKPKREHRIAVGRWKPEELMVCGWVADALAVLGWDQLQKRAVGTVWRPSDDERSRAALLRQYGAVMDRWATEIGGWDALGPVLLGHLEAMRERDKETERPVQ
ncbi:Replication initiation factor [compost metagenome]